MKIDVLLKSAAALAAVVAFGSFAVTVNAQEYNHGFGHDHSEFQGFVPGSIVLSGTVYVGNANTVTPGEVLPPRLPEHRPSYEPDSCHGQCAAFASVPDVKSDHDGRDGDLRLCER